MTIVQAAGRTVESDYIFILLVKVQQIIEMKDFEESMALLAAVERLFNDKPWSREKQEAIKYLNLLKVQLKMTEYQDCQGHNMEDLDEFIKDVKQSFNQITNISNTNEANGNIFEMLVATLLNLEQFDCWWPKAANTELFRGSPISNLSRFYCQQAAWAESADRAVIKWRYVDFDKISIFE